MTNKEEIHQKIADIEKEIEKNENYMEELRLEISHYERMNSRLEREKEDQFKELDKIEDTLWKDS